MDGNSGIQIVFSENCLPVLKIFDLGDMGAPIYADSNLYNLITGSLKISNLVYTRHSGSRIGMGVKFIE